jgi:ATP-dependent protease Clp ATPase subunit
MFKKLQKRFWRWKRDQEQKWLTGCHFCSKERHEVSCLVAGPRVFICDGCTQIAADFVVQHLSDRAARLKEAADKIPTPNEYSEDK